MTSKMKNKRQTASQTLRGLSKGSTYRFSPEIALELELYGVIRKHGSQKDIVEQSLAEYFERNPIPKKLRDAAMMILEGVE